MGQFIAILSAFISGNGLAAGRPLQRGGEGNNFDHVDDLDGDEGHSDKTPYDIVMPCELSDLCDDETSKRNGSPGCWRCKFNSKDLSSKMKEWAGHVVGILGQYNRGKTWFMSRLSDCQLAREGMTFRTEGISFKWVETTDDEDNPNSEADKYHHLVIDTAGFNTPIAIAGVQTKEIRRRRREGKAENVRVNQGRNAGDANAAAADKDEQKLDEATSMMQETEQYEQFLQSMTFALSDYLIVILNETTLSDQRFLMQVVRKWKECSQERKCKEIFVIHNFRDMHDDKDRDELFAQCTEDILDGSMDKRKGVSWFICPTLHTRHICLMNDDTNWEYNDAAFEIIRGWIHNILPKPQDPYTPQKLALRFADCSTQLLSERGFLTNVKKIKLNEDQNGEMVYTAVKLEENQPVMQLRSEDDRFYSPLISFRAAYSVRNYRSEAGSECKLIRLEAPGVSSITVRPNYKRSSVGHWAVEVSGLKEKEDDVMYVRELARQEVEGNPRLKPADRPDKGGKLNTTEPDCDSCRYGSFSELFQIPLKFKKPHVLKLGPENGVFYLLFEEEDELIDDGGSVE